MPRSSATNGLADSCATITARRPECFVVAGWGRAVCFNGAPLCPIDSAVLALGVRAVIPLFFYVAEIAAAMLLLFFAGIGGDGYFDHRRGGLYEN